MSDDDDVQIVSYSELDTFRQCPLKHALAYKARWKKAPPQNSPLVKGSLYHAVQEATFKHVMRVQSRYDGTIPAAKQPALIEYIRKNIVVPMLIDPDTAEPFTDNHDLILWMWDGYMEHFGIHPEWKIMAVEHNIVTPLPDPDGNQSRYHLKAKLDLIVMERGTGDLWVVDHKSGANLPTQMDLDIDDQFGLYTWAMRTMGRPVAGSIHMANRTQRNKGFMPLETRMGKTFLNRGQKELDNIALDAYWAAFAAYPPDPAYAPRYSAPDPRNCGWKCDFKEPHMLMRAGRDPQEVLLEWGFKIDKTRH